jgi:hypothetical protein
MGAFGDCWHVLVHRTGWVKSSAFLSVFFILYAIALSSFFNIANNSNPEASFKQPKQKGTNNNLHHTQAQVTQSHFIFFCLFLHIL